ncbi:MAG: hypothetical protein ACQEXC_14260 [Pseudomonadota bacterium]
MITASTLISTSAHDASITLGGILTSNPEHTAQLSLQLLERLQGAEGQASRRALALRTLRAAAKRIAEDNTPDPMGPSVDDLYYSLPVSDLKKVLAATPLRPAPPARRAERIVTTLLRIRGEVQCDSRRKVLLAALNKAAKQLAGQDENRRAVA